MRISYNRLLQVAACLLTFGFVAEASELQRVDRSDLGVTIIRFSGTIQSGDKSKFERFVAKLGSSRKLVLSLHSGGGLLAEALLIGDFVSKNGIVTLIEGNATCASACAYIFIAGYDNGIQSFRRLKHLSGKLGVHSGRAQVEGPLSDLVSENVVPQLIASYLYDMNAEELAPIIEKTPNDQVHWLSKGECRAAGIRVFSELDKTLLHPQ